MILKLVLLTIGASLLLLAVRRLRLYKLKERYTLVFVFIGAPFLMLALWPNALGAAAEVLHINYQTLALLSVSAFFLMIVLELLTIVSQQDRKITTLAQMVGILMAKQQDLAASKQPTIKAIHREIPTEEEELVGK